MTDKQTEPEQIVLMKRMVELAVEQRDMSAERSRMSEDRSRMSADRSRMSEDRSRMSADRSRMSEDRSRMSADRSEMSEDRSRMSAQRSEMSELRSYLNAERTLSVWVRTALSLMVFGIAIDRFGLLLRRTPGAVEHASVATAAMLNVMSNWVGVALVALSVFMVLTTGLRFLRYAQVWRQRHALPPHHGPFLATFFALMVAVFGILLLIIILVFTE
ncbi:MAG: DUF202 domain-containing protein [Xanthomonadales bacterium]|nr:DUF202 domain-containing protein [Xanthomonadales bacterium]